MSSISPLLETLVRDHPDLSFSSGEQFEWQPASKTIIYCLTDPSFDARLLHEVGHSQLNHSSYERDIGLIAMERDAWQEARINLAPLYGITISSDDINVDMDTYRDWLHERSSCPYCESAGIQTAKSNYTCVTCRKTWQVNEARTCSLKRYKL